MVIYKNIYKVNKTSLLQEHVGKLTLVTKEIPINYRIIDLKRYLDYVQEVVLNWLFRHC